MITVRQSAYTSSHHIRPNLLPSATLCCPDMQTGGLAVVAGSLCLPQPELMIHGRGGQQQPSQHRGKLPG